MATVENERYLKHLLLLGEGAPIPLRGIINREVNSRSKSLEVILSENRFRFKSISTEQYLQLFPSNSAVNADIATWNISLLVLVLKTLFWSSLSPRERSAVNTIQLYRADLHDNPSECSLMEGDFNTRRADLRAALNDLALNLDQARRQEISRVINRTGTAEFSVQSELRQVQELNEFQSDVLESLEQRFGEGYPDEAIRYLSETGGEARPYERVRPQENGSDNVHGKIQYKIQEENVVSADRTGSKLEGRNALDDLPTAVQESEEDIFQMISIETRLEELPSLDQHISDMVSRPRDPPPPDQYPSRDLRPEDEHLSNNLTGMVTHPSLMPIPDLYLATSNEASERRLTKIQGTVEELLTLQEDVRDKRPSFWQGIDTKVNVICDTASQAAEAQRSAILMLNKIITDVDVAAFFRCENVRGELDNDDSLERHNLYMLTNGNDGGRLTEETEGASGQQPNALIHPNRGSERHEETPAAVSPRSITMEIMNPSALQTNENDDVIKQRVLSAMFNNRDNQYELVEALLPFLIDILKLGDIFIMCAGEGCILLEIRCKSYKGLHNLLKYIRSDRFQAVLDVIATVLEKNFSTPVALSPVIPEGSLRDLEVFLDEEIRNMPKEKTLLLPLKYGNITALHRVRQYLQTDGAKAHLKRISEALAKISRGSTTLTTTVDNIQYKQALGSRGDRLLYPMSNGEIQIMGRR